MMECRSCWSSWRAVVTMVAGISLLVATSVQGVILCECSTEECVGEGKRTCYAAHYCYSEYFKDTLSRGCIDEGSSLLCENRKPKGIDYWPSLFCCNDRDYCNKDVTPSLPQGADKEKKKKHKPQQKPDAPGADDNNNNNNNHHVIPSAGHRPIPEGPPPPVRCSNGGAIGVDDNDSAQGSSSSSHSGGKVINPIYIAVPVAGVCVLLALVIFAMYLLRRRHHHHHFDNYHHYHDHLAHPPLHPHAKQGAGGSGASGVSSSGGGGGGGGGVGGGGVGGGGGGGVPMYHHHHHRCDCVCQKSLPPCGGKVNRCTDSERSSSGSETKLFLQA